MTAYGGGPGTITHVVLTGRMVEAERWVLQRGLPRKAVLIVQKPEHCRGVALRDGVEIVRLPSYERLAPGRRLQLRAEVRSRMTA